MSSHSQEQNTAPAQACVVPAGSGKTLSVVGDQAIIKIATSQTNGAFTVFEGVIQPLGGPPLHRHRVQDEWWYILEGEILFEVDGKVFHAGPGDTVFAPRGSSHAFMNEGATQARALVTVVPGGLDIFFEELSALAPSSALPNPATLAPLFEKYDMELLGPPLNARYKAKAA
jgi:quercetin dioxygenase-like cupin family protein